MKFSYLINFILIAVYGCKQNNTAELSGSDVQSIIHNSASADISEDQYLTQLELSNPIFDAGHVQEGDVIKHNFHIKNNGKNVLEISDTRSTCGCTIGVVGNKKIDPGKIDYIEVRFDTEGFAGLHEKKIAIIANTRPKESYFIIKAQIIAKTE